MEAATILLRHAQLLRRDCCYDFVSEQLEYLISGFMPVGAVLGIMYDIELQDIKILEFYVYRLYRALYQWIGSGEETSNDHDSASKTTDQYPMGACLNSLLVEILSTPSIPEHAFKVLFEQIGTSAVFCDFANFNGRVTAALVARRLFCRLDLALKEGICIFDEAQAAAIATELATSGASTRRMQAALAAQGGRQVGIDGVLLAVAAAAVDCRENGREAGVWKPKPPEKSTAENAAAAEKGKTPPLERPLQVSSREMWLSRM